jgi:hypothetical protein
VRCPHRAPRPRRPSGTVNKMKNQLLQLSGTDSLASRARPSSTKPYVCSALRVLGSLGHHRVCLDSLRRPRTTALQPQVPGPQTKVRSCRNHALGRLRASIGYRMLPPGQGRRAAGFSSLRRQHSISAGPGDLPRPAFVTAPGAA